MIGKELRVGFFNGLILGAIGFLMVFLFFLIKHEPIYSEVFNITEALFVSLAVFGAMAISMIIASFLGVFIPSIFKKLKIDPAVASGAFMTTLDDMIAVICYYGLVMLFLI
jgi:magnesium transporter